MDSEHSSSYAGHEAEPTPILDGGPSPSVVTFLTVFVAAVFVVRLGRMLTRKALPGLVAAEPRQQATAVAVDMGRDG